MHCPKAPRHWCRRCPPCLSVSLSHVSLSHSRRRRRRSRRSTLPAHALPERPGAACAVDFSAILSVNASRLTVVDAVNDLVSRHCRRTCPLAEMHGCSSASACGSSLILYCRRRAPRPLDAISIPSTSGGLSPPPEAHCCMSSGCTSWIVVSSLQPSYALCGAALNHALLTRSIPPTSRKAGVLCCVQNERVRGSVATKCG